MAYWPLAKFLNNLPKTLETKNEDNFWDVIPKTLETGNEENNKVTKDVIYITSEIENEDKHEVQK